MFIFGLALALSVQLNDIRLSSATDAKSLSGINNQHTVKEEETADIASSNVADNDNMQGPLAFNLAAEDKSEQKPFEYDVVKGDTIRSIASTHNLKVDTILWANGLTVNSVIKPGQKIILLPIDGALHKIQKGETLSEIALAHKADEQKIKEYNEMVNGTMLFPGDLMVIPEGQPMEPGKGKIITAQGYSGNDDSVGRADIVLAAKKSSKKLLWPTTTRRITQRYWSKHKAIDIANRSTPPIFASHNGTVTFAGRSGAWGNTILIRRNDGLQTRYSHASAVYVKVGQKVSAGNIIGIVGSTGNSTGNHLDFRVYVKGVAKNPLYYL